MSVAFLVYLVPHIVAGGCLGGFFYPAERPRGQLMSGFLRHADGGIGDALYPVSYQHSARIVDEAVVGFRVFRCESVYVSEEQRHVGQQGCFSSLCHLRNSGIYRGFVCRIQQ